MSNTPYIQGQYDTLEQVAARFGQQAAATAQMRQSVQRAVGKLRGGGWKGVGADAFLAEMDSVAFPAFQRLHNALNEARRITLSIRATLHSAENEAALLFGSAPIRPLPLDSAVGGTPSGAPTPILFSGGTPTPTATPTPPPPSEIYVGGMTIADLAAFQEDQGQSNSCGEYAAAAALDILFGAHLYTGTELTAFADTDTHVLPWFGRRMYKNGPTLPFQQVNLINDFAAANGLPVEATLHNPTRAELLQMLQQPGQTLMVTISWGIEWQPTLTSDGQNYGVSSIPIPVVENVIDNGHVMVLAAYEENGGNPRWGFVNSWTDGAASNDIFWMSDADFERAWNNDAPFMGSNNVVVVRDTTNDPVPAPTPEAEPAPTPPSPTPVPGTPVPETTPTPVPNAP